VRRAPGPRATGEGGVLGKRNVGDCGQGRATGLFKNKKSSKQGVVSFFQGLPFPEQIEGGVIQKARTQGED